MDVLSKPDPDGHPSGQLSDSLADLLEASIPEAHKTDSPDLAVNWTDVDAFACPPVEAGGASVDPEASSGHRHGYEPGQEDELFYG